MRWFGRRPEFNPESSDSQTAAVENAWKIHAAIVEWTGKVDSKARFGLAIESGIIAGVVALAGDNHALARLAGAWQLGFFWTGVLCLVVAVMAVILVVTPQLRARSAAAEWPKDFIYFGHLQHWNSEALAVALRDWDILPVLSRQLVHMSAIAWKKHRRLQMSMVFLVLGSVLILQL
jgi:Pycsar effector protein